MLSPLSDTSRPISIAAMLMVLLSLTVRAASSRAALVLVPTSAVLRPQAAACQASAAAASRSKGILFLKVSFDVKPERRAEFIQRIQAQPCKPFLLLPF